MGALGVDNPISRPKASPVLDQMAEGWGTMTVKPDQHADGKGIWGNDVWRVVITVPLATESANSPRLEPGGQTVVFWKPPAGSGPDVRDPRCVAAATAAHDKRIRTGAASRRAAR